jgi:SAM-dependent methyltransferase
MKPLFLNMSTQEIREYIQEHLHPRATDKEKDEFGEVLTHPDLIDEILDELPAAIWKRSDAKWLDPAAGTGNYSALVFSRLMGSLVAEFPDETKRKTHILGNMLYMVELNPSNVHTIRRLFGARVNISLANFLEQKEKWTRDFSSFDTFDVVLGNPPFQTPKKGTYDGGLGRRALWESFVKSGLDILKPGGYLAFLTPASWRRPESKLWDSMTRSNHLEFLRIHGKDDGKKWFDVQSRFDNYIIRKGGGGSGNTKIIDEKGVVHNNFDIRSWNFLPNYAFPVIKKLLVKDSKNGIPIIFDYAKYEARRISKTQSAKNKYPVVHTIGKKGLGILYASDRDPTQFVPKVILNANERQYPYNDHLGKYGMSQLSFGIPIKSKAEGERWIRFINSPTFQDVLKATKWGAFQTDHRMFKYFRRDLFRVGVGKTRKLGSRKKPRSTRKH